jgi:hypothetical protein
MKVRILIKQIFTYSEILILFDLKIYYLKMENYEKHSGIVTIYLLEEIPNKDEFIGRIKYYINSENYTPLDYSISEDYLRNLHKLIFIYINFMKSEHLNLFDDLYGDGEFHPDLINLYDAIPNLIKT